LDSSSDVGRSLSSLVERALEDAAGLAEVEVDSHSSWRVALFDCLRPIDGISVPGYEPSQNCKQSWGLSWPFLDHRTLGLEVEPFLKESMMIQILDMLDSPCLAQTCSVSVWWRRTIRNHFLRRLFAGRLDHRTRGCGFMTEVTDLWITMAEVTFLTPLLDLMTETKSLLDLMTQEA